LRPRRLRAGIPQSVVPPGVFCARIYVETAPCSAGWHAVEGLVHNRAQGDGQHHGAHVHQHTYDKEAQQCLQEMALVPWEWDR